MELEIKDVAKMTGIPQSTIRYYDKEGLLPFLKRKSSGYRVFDDGDLKMLQIIDCLKSTGMSIKDIQKFSKMVQKGDATLKDRYDFFVEQRKVVEEQMAHLQRRLDVIDHKCNYYQAAMKAGTEKGLENDKLPHQDEFLCQTF